MTSSLPEARLQSPQRKKNPIDLIKIEETCRPQCFADSRDKEDVTAVRHIDSTPLRRKRQHLDPPSVKKARRLGASCSVPDEGHREAKACVPRLPEKLDETPAEIPEQSSMCYQYFQDNRYIKLADFHFDTLADKCRFEDFAVTEGLTYESDEEGRYLRSLEGDHEDCITDSEIHDRSCALQKLLQLFAGSVRLMKVSEESVELSAPVKRDAHPLDVVHDIIADWARRAPEGTDGWDRWVDLQHICSMAGHKAFTRDMCIEAIDTWESLNVLCFNPEKTMVKFMVPPA